MVNLHHSHLAVVRVRPGLVVKANGGRSSRDPGDSTETWPGFSKTDKDRETQNPASWTVSWCDLVPQELDKSDVGS